MSSPAGGTSLDERTDTDLNTTPDTPWVVLLHNDPVNMMPTVVRALQKVLEISAEEAENLMMTAHLEGKVAVSSGTREECEALVLRLQAYQLWATVSHG